MDRKWKIPHPDLERQTLCFSSYKNHKLKVKLQSVGFCTIYFVRRKFFNIFVLFQCIVYEIQFQNINNF